MVMQDPGHPRDAFYFLTRISKASLAALVEGGVIARPEAGRIAAALATVVQAQSKSGAARPSDYLAFERLLIAAGGIEVSLAHSGRSRQDIGATVERMALRDAFLRAVGSLNAARSELLGLADRYANSIVPAYTWGVQAQPTTFGHVLLAYSSALARVCERAKETYPRLNRSPLGSAALATSGFNLDRELLASLLGMDGPVVNAFDAVHLAPMDTVTDLHAVAAPAALAAGALASDWLVQYGQTRPWIHLKEGEQTGVSSIMPQKRNPKGLVMLRAQASTILGLAHTALLLAHNVQPGMSDYKGFIVDPVAGGTPMALLQELEKLFAKLQIILHATSLDEKRAIQEVEADYSATTELADVLQREHGVPFRAGHHFASQIVNHGRQHQLAPDQFPYRVAQDLYAGVAHEFSLRVATLPLTHDGFRAALSARNMIETRRGIGGPQPSEVLRMTALERASLAADEQWLAQAGAKIAAAESNLDGLCSQFLSEPGAAAQD